MGKFQKLFGGAPQALPAPPPPAPVREDEDVGRAGEEERRRQKSRRGRQAQIMFGDEPEAELGGSVSRPEARGAQLLGQ